MPRSTLKILCLTAITLTSPLSADDKVQCPFPPTVNGEDWDVFWAQHYVGADLLREEIERAKVNTDTLDDLIGIWDSPREKHGEYISNIIAGPHPSAVIPADGPLKYSNFVSIFYQMKNHTRYYGKECPKKTCPAYINNAMDWDENPSIYNVLTGFKFSNFMYSLSDQMSAQDSTLIIASGNDASPVPKKIYQSALDGNTILVSSLNPEGFPSRFTSYADSITIATPSDNSLRSYDFAKNKKSSFGGTSGASALVTGTLGGFSLLSGHRLTTGQIKQILHKSAIPLPYLPRSNMIGAGMLNSYKIGRVATRIKERCSGDDRCASSLLGTEELYNFSNESLELFKQAIKSFPECNPFQKETDNPDHNTCQKNHNFNNLRRAALLATDNSSIWKALACIKKKYFKNGSDFYRNLSERVLQTNDDIIENICKNKNGYLIKYLKKTDIDKIWERQSCSHSTFRSTLKTFLKNHDKKTTVSSATNFRRAIKFARDSKELSILAQHVAKNPKLSPRERSRLLQKIIDSEKSDHKTLSAVAYSLETSTRPIKRFSQLLENIVNSTNLHESTLLSVALAIRNTKSPFRIPPSLLEKIIESKKASDSAIAAIGGSLLLPKTPVDRIPHLLEKITISEKAGDLALASVAFVIGESNVPIANASTLLRTILDSEKSDNYALSSIPYAIATSKMPIEQAFPIMSEIIYFKKTNDIILSNVARAIENLNTPTDEAFSLLEKIVSLTLEEATNPNKGPYYALGNVISALKIFETSDQDVHPLIKRILDSEDILDDISIILVIIDLIFLDVAKDPQIAQQLETLITKSSFLGEESKKSLLKDLNTMRRKN